MTVKELIEKLSELDPDLPVHRRAGKHDDWYEDVWSVCVENLNDDFEVIYPENYSEEDEVPKGTATCLIL